MSLSRGSIGQMKAGDKTIQPVLQVLSIKAVVSANSSAPQRYRLLVMDGVETISAMAATQINPRILDGSVKEFSLIKITGFMINEINQQKIVIILSFDVVESMDHQIPGLMVNTDGYVTKPVGGGAAPAAAPVAAAPTYSAPPQSTYGGSYGQQQQQSAYQAPPAPSAYGKPQGGGYGGSYGGIAAGGAPGGGANPNQTIVPINAINPYSSRWTIKARITSKSDLRRWSNAKGEGTLFSIDLLDSQGGEIKGTFFKDACEKFFPLLEEGKVYTFSNGVLKMVQNKQFNNLKNQYELTFNSNSEIHAASDDAGIKTASYDFVKIDKIANCEPNTTLDVIAVVRAASDVQEIVSTKMGGKTLQKRDLTLVDDSGCEIRCTLWGDKATAPYEWHAGPIVAIKGAKVGDYGGRTLGTMNNSSISLNPNIPEGYALNSYRESFAGGVITATSNLSAGGGGGGGGGANDSLAKRISIQSIKDNGLGLSEKADYVTVKGTVTYIRHDNDCWYTACPTPGCNKKVVEGMQGNWSCEKCNANFPDCSRRYILSMTMSDHSGQNWFSLFNDQAVQVLGSTAQQCYEMKQEGNELGYDQVFSDALFKSYVARVRVKQESVNDEQRLKCTVATLAPMDLVSECKQMIEAINKY